MGKGPEQITKVVCPTGHYYISKSVQLYDDIREMQIKSQCNTTFHSPEWLSEKERKKD